VNRAFERLSNRSVDEILGQNLFDMLAAENEPLRIASMREALARDDIWSEELVGRRAGGSQYNVQFTIAPVHDRQGVTIGYVGSQSDITRQKELDRMKDVFISDVSHELRTPITSIGLYVELLKSAPVERQKRYLEVVKDQSDVLTKLVEDILDLSRLTATKTRPLAFSGVDLNHLVEQAVIAHMAMAEASGLKLVYELAPNLPLMKAEENQMGRMITNLISNSIRYTVAGEVRVKTVQDHNKIGLIVQDTGVGIEPQDIPHLFERFFRGRNVRQSHIHGTGLGLSIVKEIVDFHGGEIEIQSEVGKGTEFQVWLPETWDS
jgi:two-component system sensor histidine kinase VicK